MVLGGVVVAAVLWLPNLWLAIALGIIVLIGAWEWCALACVRKTVWRSCYLAATVALMSVLYALGPNTSAGILIFSVLWWCLAWCWIFAAQRREITVVTLTPISLALLGWLVLLAAWLAVVELHRFSSIGPSLVLLLMAIIWGADIAAFFGGRRWGRTPLASKLSPGKTWEGVVSALAATLVIALLGFRHVDVELNRWVFVALCLGAASFSIVGDLFESLLKRRAGVKDSGKLLPGHGGVLDRVDSLTAAAPVFALGMMTMRIGS